MVNLRSALIVCCLLLAACAPTGKTSHRDVSTPPPPAGESAEQRGGVPINPPSNDARSNSTQEDRYSCRRACDRDYSVCTDTAASRRDDFSRNRTYAASTCERQLNMCFTRCN
jgi:predicted small secreted protein